MVPNGCAASLTRWESAAAGKIERCGWLVPYDLLPSIAPPKNQCAQPAVTQEESSPDQHADVDREKYLTKDWTAEADVGSNGTPKIAGQQDRTENRGGRNHIQDST